MKRILIAIILVLSLAICLPACNTKNNVDYSKFNEMFSRSYNNYKITVSSTSASGNNVTNEYMVATVNGERRVNYRTEILNQFTVDGDVIELPQEYKTVEQGTYDKTISASSKFDVPSFNFSKNTLKNFNVSTSEFSADITSLSEFMGSNVEATNAKFLLSFSGVHPDSIEISYITAENVSVVITYIFY